MNTVLDRLVTFLKWTFEAKEGQQTTGYWSRFTTVPAERKVPQLSYTLYPLLFFAAGYRSVTMMSWLYESKRINYAKVFHLSQLAALLQCQWWLARLPYHCIDTRLTRYSFSYRAGWNITAEVQSRAVQRSRICYISTKQYSARRTWKLEQKMQLYKTVNNLTGIESSAQR